MGAEMMLGCPICDPYIEKQSKQGDAFVLCQEHSPDILVYTQRKMRKQQKEEFEKDLEKLIEIAFGQWGDVNYTELENKQNDFIEKWGPK